ncbi:hypothetical protein MKK75_35155 [Methylobacterium sp. J-030]|uniref:hypothetical protein n=1 Tax=Methylobacterium sp. J-030 TaxID=2836627 RepID=UPI001FB93453|nr:hypothetical protein [Methylobacterium sp. J-030]MCJ2073971.1 hypothetical protein [Methylobacterium sp. J-030]
MGHTPDGRFESGLANDDFVLAIGRIVTFFPLLERSMSEVMSELIGGYDAPVRQIFYSITNQQARIDVMRSLLEEAQVNQSRGATWDFIIDDFASVSKSRSDYADGIWWTHETGRIFLEPPNPSSSKISNKREINLTELNDVIDRMNDLAGRLHNVIIERLEKLAARHRAEGPRD